MKDGFIQALEILEVVKKNIKDKKGNNDDDNYIFYLTLYIYLKKYFYFL